MLKFQCPFCDKKYNIPESLYGKAVRCKACQNKFTLPDAAKVKAALAQHGKTASPKQPSTSRPKPQTPSKPVAATPARAPTAAPVAPAAATSAPSVVPAAVVPTPSPPAAPSGPDGLSDMGSLDNDIFNDGFFDNPSAMVAGEPLAKLPPVQKAAPAPKKPKKRRRRPEEPEEDNPITNIGYAVWLLAAFFPLCLAGFFMQLPINFGSCVVITIILGAIGGFLIMPHYKIIGIISGLIYGSYITPAIFYYAACRDEIYYKEILLVTMVCFLPAGAISFVMKKFLHVVYYD